MAPTLNEQNVIDLIDSGQFIEAIKMYRDQTGVGLMEAKEHCDKIKFANEMKVLKCKSIDEVRNKIDRMFRTDTFKKEFILDVIDEAFYLGEDSGETSGYMRSMEENVSRRDISDGDMEQIEEDAYNNGFEDGRSEGQNEGYESAMDDQNEQSYDEGYREGLSEGRIEGHENGHQAGLEQGRAEGYESAMDERGD